MSDFGKKLLAIGVVSLIFFGLFAGITYVKVNSYDIGEATMNAAQALLAGLAIVLANMARSIFGVVLFAVATATVLAGAGVCEAGPLFSRFTRQQSSCPGGNCNAAARTPQPTPQAAPQASAPAADPLAVDLRSVRNGPLVATDNAAAENRRLDRERRIKLLNRDARAVFRRLQSDAGFRAKVAAEWNKTYAEKISPDDLDRWLEVIVKWLPYLLEIIFKLI